MKIKKLIITNFKGIQHYELAADFQDVKVVGANGTGKTTIADAINWLFFDKDTADTKQFGIRPIGCERDAATVVSMQTEKHTMTKICAEKWTKPSGQLDYVFKGLECSGEWDGIPVKITELRQKIAQELNGSEEVIRLCTRPDAFFKLKWEQKRQILASLVTPKKLEELADTEQLKEFLKELSGANLADFKKKVNKDKKSVKEEAETIPAKIEELNNLHKEVDPNVEAELKQADAEVERLNKALESANAADNTAKQQNEIQAQINKLSDQIFTARNKSANEKADLDRRRNTALCEKSATEKRIADNEAFLKDLNASIQELGKRYKEVSAQAFDHTNCICPTCGQLMPQDKMEDNEKNFNTDKANKIKDITESGFKMKERIANYTNRIAEEQKNLADLEKRIAELQNEKVQDNNTDELEKEREELRVKLTSLKVTDNGELIAQLRTAQAKRDEIRKNAGADNFNADLDKRIAELRTKQQKLGQELVRLEKMEFCAMTLDMKRMDDVEDQVNALFNTIKFRMFDKTIDGNNVETCVATIDGVDYSDANTASKVNAGIEVINVLSDHYNIECPVIIDNRESVSKLLPCKQQTIHLTVNEIQRTLSSIKIK